MSFPSDASYDESNLSDMEEQIDASDEQLLQDDPVASQPKEHHKKQFDKRYAVPTPEENQMMRSADMHVEISFIEREVGCITDDGVCSNQTPRRTR